MLANGFNLLKRSLPLLLLLLVDPPKGFKPLKRDDDELFFDPKGFKPLKRDDDELFFDPKGFRPFNKEETPLELLLPEPKGLKLLRTLRGDDPPNKLDPIDPSPLVRDSKN